MRAQIFRLILIMMLLSSLLLGGFIAGIINSQFTVKSMIEELFIGQSDKLILLVVSSLIIFTIFSTMVYLIGKKFNLFQKDEKLGTSDFAKDKEFDGFTGKDGLVIGQKFRLSEKKGFEHVVCVGPTGSGKSVSFFIPNLLMLPKTASVVVSDPKGELFEKTARHALNQGKKVLVFSPFRSNSMKYNPLALCKTVSEVRELGQILLANGNAAIEAITGTKSGGSEWSNMATPLLSAFLIYVRDLKPPKNTISYAINLIVENDIETLEMLMEDADEQARRQFNIFMQSAESEKTASSIKTVLATNLQTFMDPMIEEVTSLNEIDPKVLREEATHLYVVVPEHKSAFMAPLMAPFYTQIMNYLIENKDGSPVYFLLDEFANLGVLPNVSSYLATIRSRRISWAIGIQSINQLKERYGEQHVSILDNLKTKFIYPGSSFDTAEYFSKLLGFKEIKTTSTSQGKDNLSHSTSMQKRELMTADEIRRLKDETLLMVSDNRNPLVDNQFRYYKVPKLLKLTENELDLDEYILELREQLNRTN